MAKIEKTSNFTIGTAPNWAAEAPMRRFEQAVDALEYIAAGLTEDVAASNAVLSVHNTLRTAHTDIHALLFQGVN